MSERRRVRVLLVVGSPALGTGLGNMLESYNDSYIVADSTPSEATSLFSSFQPDVVLIDIHLPQRAAFLLCSQLIAVKPEIPVIMLSDFDWDILLAEARKSGAIGFLTKQAGQEALLAAGDQACTGRILFTPAQRRRITLWSKEFGGRLASLTRREQDVLKLLEAGYRNKEMAQALALTENTIEKHIGSVLSKFGARSRAELLVLLYRNHVEFD